MIKSCDHANNYKDKELNDIILYALGKETGHTISDHDHVYLWMPWILQATKPDHVAQWRKLVPYTSEQRFKLALSMIDYFGYNWRELVQKKLYTNVPQEMGDFCTKQTSFPWQFVGLPEQK